MNRQVSFCHYVVLIVLFGAALFARNVHALTIADFRSAIHHLNASPPQTAVEQLANVAIPRRDGGSILAYQSDNTRDKEAKNGKLVLLIHEFFGLTKSICDKADGIAQDLDCTVIAPDTFRGESSTFIPKCIWLALSTPQDRVNNDLDDVLAQYSYESLAVMGFCYGGGKAIRYTCECQPKTASTIVCYGSPVTDVTKLSQLQKPVCGVFGSQDVQFPKPLLDSFKEALIKANVDYDIQIYPDVGHAFWKDMEQIKQGIQPQLDAYNQIVGFLKKNL